MVCTTSSFDLRNTGILDDLGIAVPSTQLQFPIKTHKLRGVYEQLPPFCVRLTVQMTLQLLKSHLILTAEYAKTKLSHLHFANLTLGHAVSMFIFVFCLLVPKFSPSPPLKVISD